MNGPATRRIVLTLASPEPAAGLLDAVGLLLGAAPAQLTAVFIEDVNLLRLAGLPFAREVGRLSAAERLLSIGEVEQSLRIQANRARRLLTEVFGNSGAVLTFHVVRGTVVAVAMEHASQADVVVLSDAGARRLPRPGITTGSPHIPLGQSGNPPPMVLVTDTSPITHRALQLAADLARASSASIRALIVADDERASNRLRDWTAANFPLPTSRLRSEDFSGTGSRGLANALSRQSPGGLIAPVPSDDERLKLLLDAWARIDCFLFLVH